MSLNISVERKKSYFDATNYIVLHHRDSWIRILIHQPEDILATMIVIILVIMIVVIPVTMIAVILEIEIDILEIDIVTTIERTDETIVLIREIMTVIVHHATNRVLVTTAIEEMIDNLLATGTMTEVTLETEILAEILTNEIIRAIEIDQLIEIAIINADQILLTRRNATIRKKKGPKYRKLASIKTRVTHVNV